MNIADKIMKAAYEYEMETSYRPDTLILGIIEYKDLIVFASEYCYEYPSLKECFEDKFMGLNIISAYQREYLGVGNICKN